MLSLLSRVRSFCVRKMEQGATMAEYGLMVALVAGALIYMVKVLSEGISEVYDDAHTELKASI